MARSQAEGFREVPWHPCLRIPLNSGQIHVHFVHKIGGGRSCVRQLLLPFPCPSGSRTHLSAVDMRRYPFLKLSAWQPTKRKNPFHSPVHLVTHPTQSMANVRLTVRQTDRRQRWIDQYGNFLDRPFYFSLSAPLLFSVWSRSLSLKGRG